MFPKTPLLDYQGPVGYTIFRNSGILGDRTELEKVVLEGCSFEGCTFSLFPCFLNIYCSP